MLTVLIDDDILVHLIWKSRAKIHEKALKTYFTYEEFFAEAKALDRSTAIYVDVHLAAGVQGQTVAQKIHQLGFKTIYLATGYDPEKFAHLQFIQGVMGKDPPW